MSGSPPQMETNGALHSSAAARQSSRLIMSLSDVEYSRIRPQPVHVRLHVCNGSSWSTVANFLVPRSLCPITYAAIFAVSGKGNLIKTRILPRGSQAVNEPASLYCESVSGVWLDLLWDCSVSAPNSKINLRLRLICVVKYRQMGV